MKSIIPLFAASLPFAACTATASDSKTLFDNNCAKCHGTDGKGKTQAGLKAGAKDLTDARLPDDRIIKSIKNGMPNLSADEVTALVACIRLAEEIG